MTKWDVYIANVPFEDLPQKKVRPVVILENSVIVINCLKLTSQVPRNGEYSLQRWKEAGLAKPTVVRISKRLALDPNNLIKRIGTLHPIDIVEIQKRLSL